MIRSVLAVVALSAALTALPGQAAAPSDEEFQQIRRELRIGADVLRSALSELLPESRRVTDVEAGYLAGQGVLVVVDLTSPWFDIDAGRVDIDPGITSLEQIPDMVHDILTDMNMGLPRHQVEDLEELREIRHTQRAVRAEQRALRTSIRELRRALLRTDEAAEVEELERELGTLEAELAAAADEERALEQDVRTVRSNLDAPRAGGGDAAPMEIDRAVAESVCGYGATFMSLERGQHLNVLVRRADESWYYVFEMDRVRACQQGDVTPEALLQASFSYRS